MGNIQQAIAQRKQDGSEQWQDGYPNEQVISRDLEKGYAFVLVDEEVIIAYAAIIFDVEPAYETIEGKWLSEGNYAVIHRVATSASVRGKGFATRLFAMIEDICRSEKIYSIKVDTNFDNMQMLKILNRLNYTYCGEVFLRGGRRKAFEKLLS